MALLTLGTVCGSFILIAIVEPSFLIACAALLAINIGMASYYRHGARELKRLENLLRSDVASFFAESLNGLASVRAYGAEQRFRSRLETLVDRMCGTGRTVWIVQVRVSFAFCFAAAEVLQCWMGLRLDFGGAILVLIVALLVVLRPFNPAEIGLALSCAYSLVGATLIVQTSSPSSRVCHG